jgi:hypothetical protein
VETFKKRHPELLNHIALADERFVGYAGRRLMSVCNKEKIEKTLKCLLDENEFKRVRRPARTKQTEGNLAKLPLR